MDEYIERKKLEEAFDNADPDVCESDLDGHSDWGFGRENVRDVIRGVPAADVAPVVHGRWKLLRKGDWTSVFVCSVCGRREKIAESESYNSQLKMPREYPYSHCGARMDGDGNAFD